MALWKLTPIDPVDANWQASSHRDLTIVRAADERTARELAQKAFGVKTRFTPGEGVKAPPWLREELVSAERLHDARWDEDGPAEVLEPSV
jgi:hypothetical protein